MSGAAEAVRVADGAALLAGDLVVPRSARGIVLFAHGTGSSRHSPRNREVAARLQASGLGTLLMDLLTEIEEAADAASGEHRFDIGLLGRRVVVALDWLGARAATAGLPTHLFGASTGAAAALVGAAERPERVRSVVSRGGRPDLAGDALARVRAPVLLLVGGRDAQVLELNQWAADRLAAPCTTHVIPGATHLFPEPGALDQVSRAARDWFLSHGEPRAPDGDDRD
ncbi:hydrolase [Streptomyces sp. JJ66]|uniref:dienelactone hydrolase family protein n=1 Tax=Streptomyces sp. JJ66 TaxID=2803843 RepID=UPI001C58C1A9|nr:hydrolase [Streptomyces sp. JJ66]MBW1604529.1 hydrolase [Streptomyces sp. JJ66]